MTDRLTPEEERRLRSITSVRHTRGKMIVLHPPTEEKSIEEIWNELHPPRDIRFRRQRRD